MNAFARIPDQSENLLESSGWHGVLRRLGYQAGSAERAVRTIGFTGCRRGHGVSTVALHTAIAAGQAGASRVLLVDCNPLKPSLAQRLGTASAPGLSEVLKGDRELEEGIHATDLSYLSVMPWGLARNLRSIEISQSQEVIKGLLADYELVVCDASPLTDEPRVAELLAAMDRTALVVARDGVDSVLARQTRKLLADAEIGLAGVILNTPRNWY